MGATTDWQTWCSWSANKMPLRRSVLCQGDYYIQWLRYSTVDFVKTIMHYDCGSQERLKTEIEGWREGETEGSTAQF